MYDILLTACLTLFLEICMREGMIFGRWLEWWADFIIKRKRCAIEMIEGESLRDSKIYAAGFWLKPLGSCIVCFNFWICVFWLPFSDVGNVLFYILLSSILTRILYRLVD